MRAADVQDDSDLRVRAADDPESLLVVVFDVDARSWVRVAGDAAKGSRLLCEAVDALIAFIRAFELLHAGNRAAVITVSSSGHFLAYPSISADGVADNAVRGNHGDAWRGDDLNHALPDAVRAASAGDLESNGAPRLASALARALCIVNRARSVGDVSGSTSGPLSARILTLHTGVDDPSQYVSVMNCFFSAQHLDVAIDACVVGGSTSQSTYFQQAAFLTKGVYFRPESTDALLETLLTVFLPDPLSRDFLAMPVPGEVDFRASCFETRKVIDNGFTCSVCLSTFDISVKKNLASCPICEARFAVQRAAARKPPLKRRPPKPPTR